MTGAVEPPSSFWHAKAAIARSFAKRRPPVDADTKDTLCLIARGLFLSSCHLEAQKAVLQENGVTHVLQVGKELLPTHPAAFTYKHVPVYDLEEEDLVKYFPECFAFISAGREAGGVLVHCAAGISRSASVVIGYLMAHGGLTLDDARAAVKASRPAINPNQGFVLQLQLFQEAGCSANGWQQWNLERFLQVRSAAYARGEPATPGTHQVRGACEVAPPELNREDSLSPYCSPARPAGRGGGAPASALRSLDPDPGPGPGAVSSGLDPSMEVDGVGMLGFQLEERMGRGGEGLVSPLLGLRTPKAALAAAAGSGVQIASSVGPQCFVRQISPDDPPNFVAPAERPRVVEAPLLPVPPTGPVDRESRPDGPAALSSTSRHAAAREWDTAVSAAVAWAPLHPHPGTQPPVRSEERAIHVPSGDLQGPAAASTKPSPWRGLWGGLQGLRPSWGASSKEGAATHRVSSPSLNLPTDVGAATVLPLPGCAGGPVVSVSVEGGPAGYPEGLSTASALEVGFKLRQGMREPASPAVGRALPPGPAQVQNAQSRRSLPERHLQPPRRQEGDHEQHRGPEWAGGAIDSGDGDGGDIVRYRVSNDRDGEVGPMRSGERRQNPLRRSQSDGLAGFPSLGLSAALPSASGLQTLPWPAGGPPIAHSPRISTDSGGGGSPAATAPEADSDCRTSSSTGPSGSRGSTRSCESTRGRDDGRDGGGDRVEDGSDASSGRSGGGMLLGGAAGGHAGSPRPQPAAEAWGESPYPSPPARSLACAVPWALQPVLTPAGLERTPSKAPLTPASGAGAAGVGGGACASPEPRSVAAAHHLLWPASPLGPAAVGRPTRARAATIGSLPVGPLAAGASVSATAATAAAPQISPPAFLSHLVMALALSQRGMAALAGAPAAPTAPATAAAGLDIRADADLACSRTNSLGGAATAAAGATKAAGCATQAVATTEDLLSFPHPAQPSAGITCTEPGQQQQQQQLPPRTPAGPQLDLSQAVGVGGSSACMRTSPPSAGRPLGHRASRLATATFAEHTIAAANSIDIKDNSDGDNVNAAAGPTAETSNGPAGTLASKQGSVPCGSFGRGSRSSSSSSSSSNFSRASSGGGAETGMQHCSTASTVSAVTPMNHQGPGAAAAEGAPETAPATAVHRISEVRMRLSIRSRPSAQYHSDSGAAGSGATSAATAADAATGSGGGVTPIHKRVLRSLTSLLGRSPESPTPTHGDQGSDAGGDTDVGGEGSRGVPPAAAADDLEARSDAAGEGGCGRGVSRRRLWSGAFGPPAPAPPPTIGQVRSGLSADDSTAAAFAAVAAGGAAPAAWLRGAAPAPALASASASAAPPALTPEWRSVVGASRDGPTAPGSRAAVVAASRAAMPVPPAPSAFTGTGAGALTSPSPPSSPPAGHAVHGPAVRPWSYAGGGQLFVDTLGPASDWAPDADVSTGVDTVTACGGARALSRSRSSSPTCAAAAVAVRQGCGKLWAHDDNGDDDDGHAKAQAGNELEVDSDLRRKGGAGAVPGAGARGEARVLDPAGIHVAPPSHFGPPLDGCESRGPGTRSKSCAAEAGASLLGLQDAIDVDLLPDAPFRWNHWEREHAAALAGAPCDSDVTAAAKAAAGAAEASSQGASCLVPGSANTRCPAGSAAAAAPRAPPRRMGSRHLSLDGSGGEVAPWGSHWAAPGPGPHHVSYLASLAAVACAALLPKPSVPMGPHAPAGDSCASAGAAAAATATGGWSQVPRPGFACPTALATGTALAALPSIATATATAHPPRSSYSGALSMQPPGHVSTTLSLLPPSLRSGAAPPLRLSSSGPLPPFPAQQLKFDADALLLLPAAAAASPLETPSSGPAGLHGQGGLPPSPQSSPLPLTPAHGTPSPALPPPHFLADPLPCGLSAGSGAGGGGGGGSAWRVADSVALLPLWGGSRSSASLVTVPSEPEQDPATAGHNVGPQVHQELPEQQQQQLASRQRLFQAHAIVQPHRQSLPVPSPVPRGPLRAPVRSTSTGSSAAAHAAAAAAGSSGAGSSSGLAPEAARVWEHLRAVRQQQQQQDQQEQRHQQQAMPQQSLHQAVPGQLATTVNTTTAATFTSHQLSPHRSPLSSGGGGGGGCGSTSAALLDGDQLPAAAGGSGHPDDNNGPGSSIPNASGEAPPPGVPSSRTTAAGRLSLSPSASTASGSTGVASPRAPPAVCDPLELEPLSPRQGGGSLDAADSDAPCGASATTTAPGAATSRRRFQSSPPAVPLQAPSGAMVLPWRPGEMLPPSVRSPTSPPAQSPNAAPRVPSRPGPDPSLLRPVLARRLLPMPSPSCITASPTVTPRGGAGADAGPQLQGVHLTLAPAPVAPVSYGNAAQAFDAAPLELGAPGSAFVAPLQPPAAAAPGLGLGSAGGLTRAPSRGVDLRVLLPHELLADTRPAASPLDSAACGVLRMGEGAGITARSKSGVTQRLQVAADDVARGSSAAAAGSALGARVPAAGADDGDSALQASDEGWAVGDRTALLFGGGGGALGETARQPQQVRSPCGVCSSETNSEDGTGS